MLAAGLLCWAVVVVGCSSSGPSDPTAGVASGPPGWAGVDQRVDRRVRDDHLDGAVVVVRRGDQDLHRHLSGSYRMDTVVPMASASKWLTAALVMTVIDQGRLTLDEPVSTYAPSLGATIGAVTMRQLLSHTHGLAGVDGCLLTETDPAGAERCDRAVARTQAVAPPGTRFSYGPTGPTVAGRVVELLTGQTFEDAFQDRIAGPLAMGHTSFTTGPSGKGRTPAPDPAAGVVSSAGDYLRFVQMLATGGTLDGRAVLSPMATAAMLRLQTADARFKDDPVAADLDSVGYGLGAWIEAATPDGTATLIDGSGAYGAYPWMDTVRGVYGIVLVVDSADPGPDGAVGKSHDDVVAISQVVDEAG